MGKRCDLSDFEGGMIGGGRHAGFSISFHARQCLGFYREWRDKKHPVSHNPVGENSSLMREVEGEWQELCKLTDSKQINNTVVCRTTSRNAHLVDPCHRWAIAADDHTGFHSYQLKTRGSSIGNAITNTGQFRSGKTWSDECRLLLHHADSRVRIWCKHVSGVNGTGWWRWCNGVGNVFLAHVRSLDTNWAMIEHHRVSEHFCWPNPIEHLWEEMEWAVHSMNLLPSNLQQLCDATASAWTDIPVKRFLHLVESLFWR